MDQFKIKISGEMDVNSTIKQIQKQLKGQKVTLDVDINMKELKSQLGAVKSEAKALGQAGLSSFDKLKNKLSRLSQWVPLTTIIASFTNDVRNAVSQLKDMDTILTEISKTSNRSAENIKALRENSFDVANTYGANVSGYLTGVQEMSRAGYQGKKAEQLSELSILTQSAGNVDATVANEYLLATDAAFQLRGNVKELNKILDGQNQITNRNAVSMSDMAQATGEAASMAAQYGVKVEELSSLIATATSKTRESGSETGNALKSIFINLQDTTNKEITSTFDEIGVSMTKVVDGSEKLKTPIELLEELSDVFISLDQGDVKRADILSNIGGTYHANTLSAILSDWNAYEKILGDYSNSEGSAFKEMTKSAQSWDGRLNRLSNSWTKLVSQFVNSDGIKTGITLLQDLADGASWTAENLGAIPTAITAISAAVASYKSLKGEGRGKTTPLLNMLSLSYNNELMSA